MEIYNNKTKSSTGIDHTTMSVIKMNYAEQQIMLNALRLYSRAYSGDNIHHAELAERIADVFGEVYCSDKTVLIKI